HTDFRSFALDERFDAVVCASNSLNYVANRYELLAVFQGVSQHLAPGGLFAFDVVDESCMLRLSGQSVHRKGEGRYRITNYEDDVEAMRQESLVLFPGGFERHCRIPIEAKTVYSAASKTGMEVVEEFSVGPDFYVLRKCET